MGDECAEDAGGAVSIQRLDLPLRCCVCTPRRLRLCINTNLVSLPVHSGQHHCRTPTPWKIRSIAPVWRRRAGVWMEVFKNRTADPKPRAGDIFQGEVLGYPYIEGSA